MERQSGPTPPGDLPGQFVELAEIAPFGLSVTDTAGVLRWVNTTCARLMGRQAGELVGEVSPFCSGSPATPAGGLFDAEADRTATWELPSGSVREFSYQTHPISAGGVLVVFRDVTDERHRLRRIAAIARTAANLASLGSAAATLDALAREILQTDSVAAVQILTLDQDGRNLRVMGSAGFRHWPDFFDRLVECEDRGASLMMLEALDSAEPLVVPDRWRTIRSDPAWEPLHEYLGELAWEAFASVPLVIRNRAIGVLNVFFAHGQVVTATTLEFLTLMAEQAAIAVDYLAMLRRERDVVRREERQRLARDLHDSIVQQVFSISMQAKSLDLLAGRDPTVPAAAVQRIAEEVGLLSQTVLTDLRAMVHELRPVSATDLGGLAEAVNALVESTTNRTGMRFSVVTGEGLDRIDSAMADDIYRIVAEAVHNVVKHADAGKVVIRLMVRQSALRGTVTDDGRGLSKDTGSQQGFGLQTMRERAEQWGGTLTVSPGRAVGTVVEFVLPITAHIPGDRRHNR